MNVTEILEKCKALLQSKYQAQFKGLILYGSVARHEAGPTSDIDLLVLLKQPFDYFRELRAIVDLLYAVQLESEHLISAKPAPQDDFECGIIQLYRNVKREGIKV